ncbi:hypothetical protein B0H11DRAFT_1954614 [Mycena galericulata]|nr:hypothetical protein B0H11DRAFT_1954614 [Mycena galericulata]
MSIANAAQPNRNGTVFQFEPDLGACGWTNTSDQSVGTVSMTTFNNYPGATKNPNKNPICGRNMTIQANGVTVIVVVVDNFKEDKNAGPNDVGVTDMDFSTMANLKDGTIPNATWWIS